MRDQDYERYWHVRFGSDGQVKHVQPQENVSVVVEDKPESAVYLDVAGLYCVSYVYGKINAAINSARKTLDVSHPGWDTVHIDSDKHEREIRFIGTTARMNIYKMGVSAAEEFASDVWIVKHWAKEAARIMNRGFVHSNTRIRQSPRQTRRQ